MPARDGAQGSYSRVEAPLHASGQAHAQRDTDMTARPPPTTFAPATRTGAEQRKRAATPGPACGGSPKWVQPEATQKTF